LIGAAIWTDRRSDGSKMADQPKDGCRDNAHVAIRHARVVGSELNNLYDDACGSFLGGQASKCFWSASNVSSEIWEFIDPQTGAVLAGHWAFQFNG
jgi:hypothetical protein